MYNKKKWTSKEVITKEALNNIENGIADLDKKLQSRLDASIPENSVTMDKLGEDVRQAIEDVKDEIHASKEELNNCATKEELAAKDEIYATKEELASKDEIYATKEEVASKDEIYATKEELLAKDEIYATKEELAAKDEIHATKEELSNCATKEELAAKDEIYATKEELTSKDKIYATKEELNNYTTKEELTSKDEIYATKEEIAAKDEIYATKEELKNIDLSGYVTKDELATKDEIHATKEELKEIEQDIIDLEGRVQDSLNATIPNNSITMDKIAEDVKQAIEDAKNVDLSGYATKKELNNYATKKELENIDLSIYATKEELAAKDKIHATKEELNNYATKEELTSKDEVYATKEELAAKDKIHATKEELNNYATKEELNNYATKEELTSKDEVYATKEELENIDLSTYVTEEELRAENGDIEKLQTNEKTLVGAINELFQSANNGKELIANAIGEPLSAEDTFNAMSDGINGLLSEFKVNMMNNGVVVESGDKFKQLIDKLNTTANNSSQTLQYDQGTSSSEIISVSLNFYPIIIIATCYYRQSAVDASPDDTECYYNSIIHENEYSRIGIAPGYDYVNNGIVSFDSNNTVKDKTFKFKAYRDPSVPTSGTYYWTWFALGVGEEDTTLRDSLASILGDEGVNVTEEDDMASLINKVDKEFDRQVVPEGNAVASNVLAGKTFINSTGNLVTGNMTNQGSKTITPKSTNQTLSAGYYSGITINGDNNLKADNIVKGVTIFGVTGTASTGGYYFNSDDTGVAEVTLFQDNGEQTYSAYNTWSALSTPYTSAIEGRVKFVFQAASGRSTVRLKKISGNTTTYPTQTSISGGSYTIYSLTVDIAVGDIIQLEVYSSEGYPYYKRGVTLVTNVCEY